MPAIQTLLVRQNSTGLHASLTVPEVTSPWRYSRDPARSTPNRSDITLTVASQAWFKHGNRHTARVKTYGDVLREYEFHAESKCADAHGQPSGKQTIGLLQRRHVRIGEIKYIGKESNSLEEVEAGLIHAAQNV